MTYCNSVDLCRSPRLRSITKFSSGWATLAAVAAQVCLHSHHSPHTYNVIYQVCLPPTIRITLRCPSKISPWKWAAGFLILCMATIFVWHFHIQQFSKQVILEKFFTKLQISSLVILSLFHSVYFLNPISCFNSEMEDTVNLQGRFENTIWRNHSIIPLTSKHLKGKLAQCVNHKMVFNQM